MWLKFRQPNASGKMVKTSTEYQGDFLNRIMEQVGQVAHTKQGRRIQFLNNSTCPLQPTCPCLSFSFSIFSVSYISLIVFTNRMHTN